MPDAFWRLTFAEFHQLLRGHRRRAEQQWEHTRFLGSLMLACVSGKDAPTPEQLVPLPIDAERAALRAAVAPPTAETKAALLERIEARNKRLAAKNAPNG